MLRQGREVAVAELVVADRRALRPLMGRLWDPDREIRMRAARAVGHASSVHADLGVEMIRRLMWALNDESATHGVHAIPALGEIGRAARLVAEHLPHLSTSIDESRPDERQALRLLSAAVEGPEHDE